MRRTIILITLLAFTVTMISAQEKTCNNKLDSTEVMQLLKKKRLLYINKNLTEEEIRRTPVYQPKVEFDSDRCVWLVSSTKYKGTRKGDCKKTNGCTIVTTLHVEVDGNNKKVLSKRKEVRKVPNYE